MVVYVSLITFLLGTAETSDSASTCTHQLRFAFLFENQALGGADVCRKCSKHCLSSRGFGPKAQGCGLKVREFVGTHRFGSLYRPGKGIQTIRRAPAALPLTATISRLFVPELSLGWAGASLQNPDLPGPAPVSEPVEKFVLFCVLVACRFRSDFSLDRHPDSSLCSFRRV
ncbi:MAG: hypothetical protein QOE77_1688 [Blastocatellia bacterium]|jgi:hypothetical protein|nr:hypothetical protein [Blastocatellia bacterium]